MTSVTNTLVDEVGSPLSGVVVTIVLLSSMSSVLNAAFVGNEQIANTVVTHSDALGVWTLDLFANSLITPVGTIYQITQAVPSGSLISTFTVPDSPSTQNLSSLVS